VFDNEDVISCGCTGHLAFSSSIAPALARRKRDDAEVCIFPLCSLARHRDRPERLWSAAGDYGKVTSRIPAMYTVAFGTACDFAMRYAAAPSRSSRRELGRRSPLGNIT